MTSSEYQAALDAVRRDGMAIRTIKEQTPELCLEAVKQDWHALEFCCAQTEEVCLAAVKHYGGVLCFANVRTPEVCLAAVSNWGLHLKMFLCKLWRSAGRLSRMNRALWNMYGIRHQNCAV